MKNSSSLLLPLALCALFWCPAYAEKADRQKPMNVEADALRYDDLKQTSLFTGNVVITKGTIIIRGARIDVRQDPEGYQHGLATAAPGQLAFYRQKREGADEFIEGEAESIEYDGKADVVKFIRKAVLRRYKGASMNDETTGNQINYDNNTDIFTVDGGAANASPGNPTGRIRALLTPKDAAAAAPAPAPSAALRSTRSIDGDKR
ncbi:MAG: lipopolysaccharide transport periplasmic protein LptA [Leptothrix sp. (in: b-proteobacteria)]